MKIDSVKKKLKISKNNRRYEKLNIFLFGVLVGLLLFAFIFILSGYPRTVPFIKPLINVKQLPPGSLDMVNINHIYYYSGVLDTLYFYFTNTRICRYDNLFTAMFYISNNGIYNDSTIYLIFDKNHIRTAVYYNGTLEFFDVSAPTYIFYPNQTKIMACTLPREFGYVTKCTIIYDSGTEAYTDPQVDNLVVKKAFYQS